ncbi:hypothetical protein [Streptomyces sp. NPDC126933]|uniref:hypothetical protein n=1 Tax=unclassified Streptomyces TaxID=2593676 RepID=UPI0036636833
MQALPAALSRAVRWQVRQHARNDGIMPMGYQEQPPTMLGHGKLPYPAGTLVVDTISERTGHLVGVIEERSKESGKVVSAQAFMRPEGGGIEWDVPLDRIEPVAGDQG